MSVHPGWSSGDMITITSYGQKNNIKYDFLIDMKGKNSFSLSYKEKPYNRLNITMSTTGEVQVEVRNCVGKNSFFQLEKYQNGYRIKSLLRIKQKNKKEKKESIDLINGNNNKENDDKDKQQQEEYYYLIWNGRNSQLEVISESLIDSSSIYSSCFDINVIRGYSYSDQVSNNSYQMKSSNILSKWDKKRFKMDGFMHISNVILPEIIFDCVHLLMHSLGVPGSVCAGGTQDGLGKLGGHLSNCNEIRSLLLHPDSSKGKNISLLNIIEELLGDGNVNMGSISGQIALRFPEYVQDNPLCSTRCNFIQQSDGSYPIGSAWHTDGFRQGKYHGFSILVGVCLSDCLDDFCGNLLLWPGSHIPIHKTLVGRIGGLDLELLTKLLRDEENGCIEKESSSDTCKGDDNEPDENGSHSPCVGNKTDQRHDNEPSCLPNLGLPHQLHLRAGDVIFLHPDTAHCGGPNFSCVIRNMIYFRIKHIDIRNNDDEYLEKMWIDMPGI